MGLSELTALEYGAGLRRRPLSFPEDLKAVLDAETFARTVLGFQPDPVQASMLRDEHPQLLLLCARQWGKSTVTAIKAIHRAWTRPECLVLVVGPGERQTGEFMRKASMFLRRLGIKPRGDGYNSISLLLPNGSRMVSVPAREATSRGFSAASLLVVEEAARVPDEHYDAMTPCLDKHSGDLWLLSTAWAQSGFFWKFWTDGDPDWTRVTVRATDCPERFPDQYLARERKQKGEATFRREFLCEFMDAGASLFDRQRLMAMLQTELRPMWPDRR